MKVTHHVLVSTAVSGGVYLMTRSIPLTLGSCISGWVIDVDHLLDYLVEHGPRPDASHFFATFRDDKYRRARLVLHGWEWPLLIAAASLVTRPSLTIGVAVGWLQHLVFDQLTNSPSPLGYSIMWRAMHGFRYRKSFPGSASPSELRCRCASLEWGTGH
jgi:hypothetical protein